MEKAGEDRLDDFFRCNFCAESGADSIAGNSNQFVDKFAMNGRFGKAVSLLSIVQDRGKFLQKMCRTRLRGSVRQFAGRLCTKYWEETTQDIMDRDLGSGKFNV